MAGNHTTKHDPNNVGSSSNSVLDNTDSVKLTSYAEKQTDERKPDSRDSDNVPRNIGGKNSKPYLDNEDEYIKLTKYEKRQTEKQDKEPRSRLPGNIRRVNDVHNSSAGESNSNVNEAAGNSKKGNTIVNQGTFNKLDVNLTQKENQHDTNDYRMTKDSTFEAENINVENGVFNHLSVTLTDSKDGDRNGKFKHDADNEQKSNENSSKEVEHTVSEDVKNQQSFGTGTVIIKNSSVNNIGNQNPIALTAATDIKIVNSSYNNIGNGRSPTAEIERENKNDENKVGSPMMDTNSCNSTEERQEVTMNVEPPAMDTNSCENTDEKERIIVNIPTGNEQEKKRNSEVKFLNVAIIIFVLLLVILVIAFVVTMKLQ